MEEMSNLQWTNVTVKLSQLAPWEGNPKTSTAKNAKQLQSSRDELGQFQTVAIEPTDKPDMYRVADGHQRLSAWLMEYGKDSEIAARLASRPLTEKERRKIAIYSRQIGAWDWDILSGWDEPLIDWGFDTDLLKDLGNDYSNLAEMLGVTPPIPEPKEQREPELKSDHIVMIYCSGSALVMIQDTLSEWAEADDIEIDIS